MSTIRNINELKALLASNLIRERRAGISIAVEMLAADFNSDEVRTLLENIVKNDLITNVQNDARKALAIDNARRSPVPAKSPDYIFNVRCPKGHVNSYDKREYCPRNGNVIRRTVVRGIHNVDEILIHCKTSGCGEDFYVEVDCEGYK